MVFKRVSKFLLALVGVLFGAVLLLLIAVASILYVPSIRQTVLEKGVSITNDLTDYDIDLGHLYLSPFHHSPLRFYRAYKGQEDLTVEVQIDSLFVGHRGQDTLAYIHTLRVKATAHTKNLSTIDSILSTPISVEQLQLDRITFHSDPLIPTVGVDVILPHLSLTSPQINIAEGLYPLHGLQLYGADVAIDLRPTTPDTVPTEPKPLKLCFEVPDGDLRDIHYSMTPLKLDIRTRSIRTTQVIVNPGINRYVAPRIDIGGFAFRLDQLRIPVIDTVYGDAHVDLATNLITTQSLHTRSDEIGAKAAVSMTQMNLASMRIDVIADASFQGSQASVRGYYDIDDETYDASVRIDKVDLTPFTSSLLPLTLQGNLQAKGRGVNPKRPIYSSVNLHLDEAIYGPYDFSRTDFKGSTDSVTALHLKMPSLQADIHSPLPLLSVIDRILPLVETVSDSAVLHGLTSLSDLTVLDTIRTKIPALSADIALRHASPIQPLIDSLGLDISALDLAFHSDSQLTHIQSTISNLQLPISNSPSITAALTADMTDGLTNASIAASTALTDGIMEVYGLCVEAAFKMDLERCGKNLNGTGRLTLDSLSYTHMYLGNHTVDLQVSPSHIYPHALRADVQLDTLPLSLMESFVTLPEEIALRGDIRAAASVDGLPRKADISAQVQPLGVAAAYTPYQIGISLGETPIIMSHNHIDLNGLPVYAVDSTYLALYGGLDLDSMRLDIRLEADSFAPVKLPKDGPFPVFGELATDIHGTVTGALDSIIADVDITLLPVTDITYPIDRKNLAQVKPHGSVNIHCPVANIDSLSLNGKIRVDDGFIRFSPKIYPVMPFHVDSGSHIAFQGPIGKTLLNVSASQKVKADVESADEETRRVDFTTGVRINGEVDSIGIHSIGFFLEAPADEEVTRELASVNQDTREGLAAALLATGIYAGESNVAAQREGYALSSIINSRLNAAMANSQVGKFMDVDISSGQTQHATGKTNDMNISLSKSFFKDKLRITIGSTLTDDPEINKANGLFTNFTADYKLTKDGTVQLRLFSQRDYNNVLEGELYKSGLAVRATKEWKHKYGLTADAGVAYRSNNSIGPDLTLKSTIKNIFGHGETFTLKGSGSYFWALRNRHPGDPKKTDTYKLGVNASLIFPYLHWGNHKSSIPEGDTRYMLGYQYENIAGGYGVHKLSGSFTYFIRSSNYIMHAFTPFSLSVVMLKAESANLLDKAAEYPQLIKVIASDEFVPSVSYDFIYDDYRAKRAVNTFLDLGVKESGNLINALYCAFGRSWNEKDKPLGKITFNQFVKLSAELHNRFNITDQISIATRLFAGANIPLGNSYITPLSEAFYTGGPNSLRASSPYAYGPGNFFSAKYNQNFFHAGDIKLEANFEFRFPIVWKLYGAAFVDAGNVWNWVSTTDIFKEAGMEEYIAKLEIPADLHDGIFNNPDFAKQIALGTGAGLRLDLDGLVIRLDIGVGIHAPYQTFHYDKSGKTDYTRPINTYFNIPSALDAIRFNFGIGYPF